MNHIITASIRYMALIVALLFLAGCNKSCTGTFTSTSGSSTSDVTVNGHRTITKKHDGVTRKLETTSDVVIQNGRITAFPKAALVKIQETGGPEPRQAELRENAGSLELWINDKGTFRKGSPEDETWLESFLNDVTAK